VSWLTLHEIFALSTPVTPELVEHAPADVLVPEIWYIPNSQLVEAIFSISMVPSYLFEELKATVDHPDYAHINQHLLKSLSTEQLEQIKNMWKFASGMAGRKDRQSFDQSLSRDEIGNEAKAGYAIEEGIGMLSNDAKLPAMQGSNNVALKLAHLVFCSKEMFLFWASYFSLTTDASTLWALPQVGGYNDCITAAKEREVPVKAAFYTIGSIGMVALCGAKLYLDFDAVRGTRFASMEYLLNIEYSRKDPWNRLLAAGMLAFAAFFGFQLVIIASANSYAYPLTQGLVALSFVTMLYAGFQLYFHTSIVGMQHLKNRVPDVTLPLRVWTSSAVMLNHLMQFCMLSEKQLSRIGDEVREDIQGLSRSALVWDVMRRKVMGIFDPNYVQIDRSIALKVSGSDLIKIKRHMWAEYWDPNDEGFDRGACHVEHTRALMHATRRAWKVFGECRACFCR
jgi:hypothetical protein